MEKLIELLNEYENEKNSDLYYKFELENWELYCYDDVTDVLWTMQDEAMVICSKQFWFIKWLVENDKISRDKLFQDWLFHMFYNDVDYVKKYDILIMYLAVEYNPIEFLCSILK